MHIQMAAYSSTSLGTACVRKRIFFYYESDSTDTHNGTIESLCSPTNITDAYAWNYILILSFK